MNVQRLEGEYMLTIILHKRPALNNIALLTLPKLLELHSPPSSYAQQTLVGVGLTNSITAVTPSETVTVTVTFTVSVTPPSP